MKKLLLFLVAVVTTCFAGTAETWSYTVTKGQYGKHDHNNVIADTQSNIVFQKGETNEQTWSVLIESIDTSAKPLVSNDGNNPAAGILIGAAAKPPRAITLYSGTNFSGKHIDKVTFVVVGGANSNCSYNATLTVGGYVDTRANAVTGNKSATTLEWTPNTTGEIQITFSNNITAVGKSKNAGLKICSISVEYSDGGVTPDPSKQDVTTFAWSAESVDAVIGEDFVAPTFSCDPEGLAVAFSSSNTEVANVDNNGVITLGSTVGSAVITASFAGDDTYNPASAKVTVNTSKVYDSIAKILTAKKGEAISVRCPLTVCYVLGRNCYVTDGNNGYILLYSTNKNYTFSYNIGDVIPAGMEATYTIYNGLPELQASSFPTEVQQGEYSIEVITAGNLANQPLNKVVSIDNVVFAEATPESSEFTGVADGIDIKFYNSNRIPSVPAGKYEVILAVSTYTQNATEITEPSQYAPLKYIAIPAEPTVLVAGVAPADPEATIDLKGGSVTVTITAEEGQHIYYKHVSNTATKANEEYTHVENNVADVTIDKNGTLYYYAKNPETGKNSTVGTLTFSNDSTSGIAEVGAEAAEAEWFDVQGRRVAAPAKGGIYILKQGSKVSKRIL